ncbi:hypothetical protein HETIRDRAFT_109216 [Heterobasidion irregulare TC 32-1]|uniref:Uncharacterized protein n=1 Tax=Heterobasidion irregulare (strain TC 32-1) TaxID=747525 RepID=W4KGU5_HETIT|nr:uncharacterized protein HETIRDRAFT_109216 [Heterobasidion irregulare TC 32-1]ETW84934.1 hypothetical protein HETIRDRAFT_109216 [Heterobasidion irregulare TC 32-1]
MPHLNPMATSREAAAPATDKIISQAIPVASNNTSLSTYPPAFDQPADERTTSLSAGTPHRWVAPQPRETPSNAHYDLSIMVLCRRGLVSHPSVITLYYLTQPPRVLHNDLEHAAPAKTSPSSCQALAIRLASIDRTDHTTSSSAI